MSSRRLSRVELLVAVVALLTVGVLTHLTSRTAAVERASLTNAEVSSDLKSRLTLAYLRFREALAGDHYVDVNRDVFANLDEAVARCEAMRDGGDTPFGSMAAVDGRARLNAARLCRNLNAFRSLTEERWTTGSTSATGHSDQEAHAVFRDILWDLDLNSVAMQQEARANRRLQERTNLGTLAGLMILFGCVVALVRHHRRLLEARNVDLASLASIVEGSGDAIAGTGPDGRIVSWNSAAESLFGHTAEEVAGRPIGVVVQAKDATRIGAMVDAVRQNGVVQHDDDVPCRTKDGRTIPTSVSLSPIKDDAGSVVALSMIARDTSQRKALEKRLEHRALHDPLTGLGNRALFAERVTHALLRSTRERKQVAVLFLDLDGFKAVNDTLGHGAGDELLVAVAERLRSCTRPEDSVARLGGDEFALLLEGAEVLGDAVGVAQRILVALATPVTVRDRALLVGASIGVALAAEGGVGAKELLRNADLAMYRAKSDGKASYRVFEPSMHTGVLVTSRP